MVFKTNETHVEADDFRADGLRSWADTWAEQVSAQYRYMTCSGLFLP